MRIHNHKLLARACLKSLQEGLSRQFRLGKLLRERVKLRQELLGLTQRALVGAAHREHQLKPAHLYTRFTILKGV